MDEVQLNQKMKAMQFSVDAAMYLSACPVLPASIDAGDLSPDEDHLLSNRCVAHLLHAFILELAIKVIWELDNGQSCRFTHDISTLYGELTSTSQSDLKQLFDRHTNFLPNVEGTSRDGTAVRLGELTQFQSWEETLATNQDVVKDFKYDGEFRGKSTAMGAVMWNEKEKRVWAFPPKEWPFPKALHRYTQDRVQRWESGKAT